MQLGRLIKVSYTSVYNTKYPRCLGQLLPFSTILNVLVKLSRVLRATVSFGAMGIANKKYT